MLTAQRELLVSLLDEQWGDALSVAERPPDPPVLHRRALRLVDALLAALAGEPHAFARPVAELAEAHADDAVFLAALQSSLAHLEERAWSALVAESADDERVDALRRLTRIFVEARDTLLRLFLAHKQRAESELARLEARFEAVLNRQTPHGELREDD